MRSYKVQDQKDEERRKRCLSADLNLYNKHRQFSKREADDGVVRGIYMGGRVFALCAKVCKSGSICNRV